MDYSRILDILNPAALRATRLLAVGCGSGNAQAVAELAKNGIARFELWDHDALAPENLVRHLLGRSSLGRNKAEALRDRILDRNEQAVAHAFASRFEDSPEFAAALAEPGHKLALCGLDDMNGRFRLNRACVQTRTPMVLAMVFRRGIGGMVFRYEPGACGCFNCLYEFAQANGLFLDEADIEPAGRSREEVYGLGLDAFKKSPGLSIDIGFISLIMARLALDALVPDTARLDFPRLSSNLVTFATRPDPAHGMRKFFDATHFRLHPQRGCPVCG